MNKGEPVAPLSVLEGKSYRNVRQEQPFAFGQKQNAFDNPKILKALKHNLKAKAVLAAGLKVFMTIKLIMKKIEWQFEKMVWLTI